MFEEYDTETGDTPMTQEEPTRDQLQALSVVIIVVKSPYTDFARVICSQGP